MNDEDFVETSDPEEREELLQARSPLYTELVVLPSGPGVVRDPRKRRKVSVLILTCLLALLHYPLTKFLALPS